MVCGFLDSWKSRRPLKNALILYGEPGNGKTSLVYALEKIYKLNIIEINSSNKRNASDLISLLRISGSNSFDDKFTIILLDEADGIRAWKVIEDLVRWTKCPIIMTCNYIDKIPYEVIKECVSVQIEYPTTYDITKRLKQICSKERVKVDRKYIEKIALKCNSMRNAILTLQRCVVSQEFKRIKPQDIDYSEESQIKRLFSGEDDNISLDAETVRKWAIANDISIHRLDRMRRLSRTVPGMQPVLEAYTKTIRGKVSKLKNPYYRAFNREKKVEKQETKKYVAKTEKKSTIIETTVLLERTTFEDESLW